MLKLFVTNSQAEQEKEVLQIFKKQQQHQSLTLKLRKELTEAVSNNSNSTIESAKKPCPIFNNSRNLKRKFGKYKPTSL